MVLTTSDWTSIQVPSFLPGNLDIVEERTSGNPLFWWNSQWGCLWMRESPWKTLLYLWLLVCSMPLTSFIFYHSLAYSSFPVNSPIMSVQASSLNIGHWAWTSPCILAHIEWKRNPTPKWPSSFEDDAILGILIQTQDEPENLNLFDEVLNDLNISTNGVHHWILDTWHIVLFKKYFLLNKWKQP